MMTWASNESTKNEFFFSRLNAPSELQPTAVVGTNYFELYCGFKFQQDKAYQRDGYQIVFSVNVRGNHPATLYVLSYFICPISKKMVPGI